MPSAVCTHRCNLLYVSRIHNLPHLLIWPRSPWLHIISPLWLSLISPARAKAPSDLWPHWKRGHLSHALLTSSGQNESHTRLFYLPHSYGHHSPPHSVNGKCVCVCGCCCAVKQLHTLCVCVFIHGQRFGIKPLQLSIYHHIIRYVKTCHCPKLCKYVLQTGHY